MTAGRNITIEKTWMGWMATYPVWEAERSWAVCFSRSRERCEAKARRLVAKSQERAKRYRENQYEVKV